MAVEPGPMDTRPSLSPIRALALGGLGVVVFLLLGGTAISLVPGWYLLDNPLFAPVLGAVTLGLLAWLHRTFGSLKLPAGIILGLSAAAIAFIVSELSKLPGHF